MYLSGGQTIQRSMNGLLKISASEIDTTNASITNINNVENISGAIGSDLVIDVDTGKIIQLKDNTQIDTNLNVIGNTHTGTLDVSNNSIFNGNVFSNLNLHSNTFDVSNTSIFNGNIFANLNTHTNTFDVSNTSTFNGNVFSNLNLHTNTFDVSNASIFNGSITCKGITSNGVCNFNNPVLTNSSLIANSSLTANSIDVSNNAVFRSSIDVSTNSTFRNNLSVLKQLNVTGTTTLSGLVNVSGQLNVFQDSTFDKNLIVNEGIYSYGPTNQMDGSLNILGNLKVNRNIDVSSNLYVGKNNPAQTSSVDLTGTIYLRDPSQPNVVYMRIYYEPNLYGFVFQSETQGRNMNFRVKDNAGNYKLFYFGAGQLYSSIFTYIDTHLNVSFNNRFTLGDSNGTTQWFGVSQSYVPNTATTSGFVIYNKGLMNNATYYTNWVHVNTSNVDVPTMRMSWERIWSKVPHTMESTLTVAGNMTLTGDLIANSTNITPIELSYLDNVTSNIQTQLNSKLNLSGGTLSGSLTFSDATIQSSAFTNTLNTKLTAIGTTVTATLSGTTTLNSGTIFNCGSMSLTPGTYMISVFCYVDVTGGSTIVNNMSAAYSTSATAYSHNVDSTWSGGGLTYNSGSTFSLNHTDWVVVSSTTTYYMITRCNFGTILRMRFITTFSKFSAVRIA